MELLFEKEVRRSYEDQIASYHLFAEVHMKFAPYKGNGLVLNTTVEEADKVEQFLPAIRSGLNACMKFFSVQGVKAIWIDGLLGSDQACDLAFSWAAALALREAVSADSTEVSSSDDKEWLKAVGLYTEDKKDLEAYQREQICKEHPWAKALYESDDANMRLSIIREAATIGDEFAKVLLEMESDDPAEKFEMAKEEALRDGDLHSLVKVCEYYDKGIGVDPHDADAIVLHIRLGDAYKEWRDSATAEWVEKMVEAYERAWSHAERLGVSAERFMQAFAERVADTMKDEHEPFCNRNVALQWYRRAGSDKWSVRVKIALMTYDRNESLFLGDCYAKGTSSVVQDDKLAEIFYKQVRTEAVLIAQRRICAGEKIKYGDDPLDAIIEEKLGDLYAHEGGPLYSYKAAFECYKTAASNSVTAKEKLLQLMQRKKELGEQS